MVNEGDMCCSVGVFHAGADRDTNEVVSVVQASNQLFVFWEPWSDPGVNQPLILETTSYGHRWSRKVVVTSIVASVAEEALAFNLQGGAMTTDPQLLRNILRTLPGTQKMRDILG